MLVRRTILPPVLVDSLALELPVGDADLDEDEEDALEWPELPLRPALPAESAYDADALAEAWGIYQNVEEQSDWRKLGRKWRCDLGSCPCPRQALDAFATASAYGVSQEFSELGTATSHVDNDGLIAVRGPSLTHLTTRRPIRMPRALAPMPMAMATESSTSSSIRRTTNLIHVRANAYSDGYAYARVDGIDVHTFADDGTAPTIEGNTYNYDEINVRARAEVWRAESTSVGIHHDSPQNLSSIYNSGIIFSRARAIGEDANAEAWGVLVTNDRNRERRRRYDVCL